jgi:hypothetical protein
MQSTEEQHHRAGNGEGYEQVAKEMHAFHCLSSSLRSQLLVGA